MSFRWTEEALQEFHKRAQQWRENGKTRVHKLDAVDIDKVHRLPKYRNKRTETDGIWFDSKKEARRWGELKLMEKAGEILELKHHVRFDITVNRTKVCGYEADFVYRKAQGYELVVEDAKGCRTREYVLKKKLMKAVHGIEILET